MSRRRTGSAAKRRQKHTRAVAAVPNSPLHPLYLPPGPFSEFRGLLHKHYIAREQAPANGVPEVLNPVDTYVLDSN